MRHTSMGLERNTPDVTPLRRDQHPRVASRRPLKDSDGRYVTVAPDVLRTPHDDAADSPTVPARTAASAESPAAERNATSLQIVPILAVVAALWAGQVVLIPIVLSVLISYALEPLVARLERRRIPRSLVVPILLTALLAAGGTGAYVLRGQVVAFVDHLPVAAHTVAEAIRDARGGTPGTVARVQEAARELESAASGATQKRAQDGVTAVRIEEPTFKWSDWLWRGSHGAIEFAGQMLAVLCLVYYLLAAGDLYKRKLIRMVPTLSDRKVTVEILAEIDRQIERFLFARVVISLIVGVAVWAAFYLLGLEQAGVWGVLSAVLFAIPIVGPTLVVVAAAIAAFVQFGTLGMAAGVGAVCTFIGIIEGNVLTPWLMSRAGAMNAGAVFVSLLFWGWIWGVWGLLLAVPITAAAKAVCERVPDLSAFAELLKE
jgi:predicted PurR-regulated permease PerM